MIKFFNLRVEKLNELNPYLLFLVLLFIFFLLRHQYKPHFPCTPHSENSSVKKNPYNPGSMIRSDKRQNVQNRFFFFFFKTINVL